MVPHFNLNIPGLKPGDKTLAVRAPYNDALIATVEIADEKVLEHALKTAYHLHRDRDTWLSLPERIRILERTAALMEPRAEDLALMAAGEGGKPLIDSRVEVARAIESVKICIQTLRSQQGSVIPMNLNAASRGRLAFTQFEPTGVVAAISAFNHPLNLIVHQVGPAVATGCPVIVKPASSTPLSCLNFVQILREAGLPPEWCQTLVLKENSLAERLATDSRVAFLSFIGSATVGWGLRAKLAAGTRCALEHGGVAPVIVAADADLEEAIPLLAKGGFYHAGQVCVSVQRVFAHESIVRPLATQLAAVAKKLRIGDPTSPHTEVGPLIRHSEIDRVERWVNDAIGGGAECLSGGKRISPSCYECTVLLNPPAHAEISTEEVFGPVVCVYSYQNIDEAIARANALPYAFQAAVFTKDMDTALSVSKRLDASAVMVNDHTAFRVDWMPFAGLKHSGLGIGGIPYTMHDMQIEKMVVLRTKGI
jgi:acyl-CoA reductase-like NAD-dependent aldehyde dehydrogenase